jgi:hypothetical protein
VQELGAAAERIRVLGSIKGSVCSPWPVASVLLYPSCIYLVSLSFGIKVVAI